MDSIIELCRVAKEVRIFPLLGLGSVPSPHVNPVIETVKRMEWQAEIETVPYEFQRGGNQMLRIIHQLS